jgi:hypothetical protein
MKLKWTREDRELKGPGTYERYNAFAKKAKERYHSILIWQLLTLVAIALVSSVPDIFIGGSRIIQYLTLILILFFMALMIIQYRSNQMQAWQKSRFLAESTLSEGWFFLFALDPYKAGLNAAKEAFLERIRTMRTELKMPVLNYTFGYKEGAAENGILEDEHPAWMVDNYGKPLKEKIEYYIKYRIDDQLKYYTARTKKNANKSTLYFTTGLFLNIAGAILAILSIGNILPSYAYLGVFTTISAAFVSWTQTKQYEEISTKSSVATEELMELKNELRLMLPSPVQAAVEKKVFEAEKLISREHKVKRS